MSGRRQKPSDACHERALGERIGLPQSHVSKIEGGGVDMQVSSLVALARALDLELMLIPRTSLNAVRAVQEKGLLKPSFPLEAHARTLREIKRIASAEARAVPLFRCSRGWFASSATCCTSRTCRRRSRPRS